MNTRRTNSESNSLTQFCRNFAAIHGVQLHRHNNQSTVLRNKNGDVVTYKDSRGKLQVKRQSNNVTRGMTDLHGNCENTGIAFYVEVKTGKDKVRPDQEIFMKQKKLQGCVVIVARNRNQFQREFQEKRKEVYKKCLQKLSQIVV